MIGKAWNALALAALFAAGVQPAAAQGTGSLTSKIELEKSTPSSDGQPPKTTYVAPDVVVPGDRVRVALTFTNHGAAPAAGRQEYCIYPYRISPYYAVSYYERREKGVNGLFFS